MSNIQHICPMDRGALIYQIGTDLNERLALLVILTFLAGIVDNVIEYCVQVCSRSMHLTRNAVQQLGGQHLPSKSVGWQIEAPTGNE